MSQLYPFLSLTTRLRNMQLNASFCLGLRVNRGLPFPSSLQLKRYNYAFIILPFVLDVKTMLSLSSDFLYIILLVKRITTKKAKVFGGPQSQEGSKYLGRVQIISSSLFLYFICLECKQHPQTSFLRRETIFHNHLNYIQNIIL